MISIGDNFTYTLDMDSDELAIQPGCDGACINIPDTMYKSVVSGICEHIDDIHDSEIRMQVRRFCSILSAGLLRFQPGIRLDPMYVDIGDDEAYFEWIFDNFRFGFSFHHDLRESYWFQVSLDSNGNSSRFRGDFNAGFVPAVRFALDYIGRNA